jgi:hypothetical protein
MKRPTIVVVLLIVALVVSNGWWAYNAVDAGITATYHDHAFQEHRQALTELLAVAPVAASLSASRESVLASAQAAAKHGTEFEKEGFVWVGELGYRFSDEGRLLEVRTEWSPF